MQDFTSESLPQAIKELFELNNYQVKGPVQIHGAEIDLVAQPLADPFGSPIYIEATIEHVNNDKYGKDVGKLAMISELEPSSKKLIVSSKGFSLPVQERAKKTRIETLTYDELFQKFERFSPYITDLTVSGQRAEELKSLNEIYEEPSLEDKIGNEQATEYLYNWRDSGDIKKGWLIIIGEYGTGKTALTKILQYRWLNEHKRNPSLPIPIRIELRNFTRQFDARGLLHHFLDNNNLSHLPVDFVYSLIRNGRIILLLDGYDEMAQYLHARERRTCLEALAELSSDGARGIITSRPNYFTEAEELEVFDILYRSLNVHRESFFVSEESLISRQEQEILDKEKHVDELLEKFIDRYERTLRDLTQSQTEGLVKRVLVNDQTGQEIVLGLLQRIFKTSKQGDAVSLSGKPVIISYLLEVVENLKQVPKEKQPIGKISEWQVFELIIDQLMIRDLARSSELTPKQRREFLQLLALSLSKKDNAQIHEADFKDLIGRQFKRDLVRLPSDSRIDQLERFFADLRSSTTLTRNSNYENEGWRFSHNILREFLLTEYLINGLLRESIIREIVPISDAMKSFINTLSLKIKKELMISLSQAWKSNRRGCGQLLSLLWDGFLPLFENQDSLAQACLEEITGKPIDFNSIEISKIKFSSELDSANISKGNFVSSTLIDVNFSSANLSEANFTDSMLENITFNSSNLKGTCFCGSIIIDAEFFDTNIENAKFSQIDPELISILVDDRGSTKGKKRLEGLDALGYLNFYGAHTDELPRNLILKHHPLFPVVNKIVNKLVSQPLHQKIGLEQRGAAKANIPFAQKFLKFLEASGYIKTRKDRKQPLVEVTELGRNEFSGFDKTGNFSDSILNFLEEN
ncbi:MAG: NACHT domain-containing protein [Cyanobacteriota bacterium]|nr:NACHT domain-containing protein [Cyanobacteriota bacterium]